MGSPTTAEYPSAIWMPAHISNYFPRSRRPADVRNIVIHVTDGRPDPIRVAEMWQEPSHRSSAHYVVGQDGRVVQAVLLADIAYHAHAANATSIGVEHCARSPGELGPGDAGLPASQEQYEASARLVAWLCALCGLPATRVVIQGHCEIDQTTTHADCPNAIWDWARYMELVVRELTALQPVPVG